MKVSIATSLVLVAAAIWVAVWEIYAALFLKVEDTITYTIRGWSEFFPALPLLVGLILGHIFWCAHWDKVRVPTPDLSPRQGDPVAPSPTSTPTSSHTSTIQTPSRVLEAARPGVYRGQDGGPIVGVFRVVGYLAEAAAIALVMAALAVGGVLSFTRLP